MRRMSRKRERVAMHIIHLLLLFVTTQRNLITTMYPIPLECRRRKTDCWTDRSGWVVWVSGNGIGRREAVVVEIKNRETFNPLTEHSKLNLHVQ